MTIDEFQFITPYNTIGKPDFVFNYYTFSREHLIRKPNIHWSIIPNFQYTLLVYWI